MSIAEPGDQPELQPSPLHPINQTLMAERVNGSHSWVKTIWQLQLSLQTFKRLRAWSKRTIWSVRTKVELLQGTLCQTNTGTVRHIAQGVEQHCHAVSGFWWGGYALRAQLDWSEVGEQWVTPATEEHQDKSASAVTCVDDDLWGRLIFISS